jgi:hypothetical protein
MENVKQMISMPCFQVITEGICTEPQASTPTLLGSTLSHLPLKEKGESPLVVGDTTLQEIQFNIMPDRPSN